MTIYKSGRARFTDTPAAIGPVDPVGHVAVQLAAGGSGLEDGETVVGSYPPGKYRLISDETGVRVVRRDPDTKTADAGPISIAEIQARNDRFWKARK